MIMIKSLISAKLRGRCMDYGDANICYSFYYSILVVCKSWIDFNGLKKGVRRVLQRKVSGHKSINYIEASVSTS
jgi:hypothetical protein